MVVILLYFVFYLMFILIDLFPIYKNKQWNYFWFYTIVMFIAFTITTLDILNFQLPSPAKPIEQLMRLIFQK